MAPGEPTSLLPGFADFAQCLNQSFSLGLQQTGLEGQAGFEGPSVVLQLVEANEHDTPALAATARGDQVETAAEARSKQFSLVFSGPREPQLSQRTYTLVHSMLGELALFLVPIGPHKDGMAYEAVFT